MLLWHINCLHHQIYFYFRLIQTLNQQISMKKNQGWEITTASSKLAECQESIANLGKQLKALASSSEAALLDKVVSTTSSMDIPSQKKNLIKRSSLRNHMQAEDGVKEEMPKSLEKEESKSTEDAQQPPLLQSENGSVLQTDKTSKQNDRSNAKGHLAIVPRRKQGALDFLRKLFLRRKKGRSRGTR